MKVKASYTIEKEILDKFNNLADRESINRSKWIENQMVKFIEDRKVGS